MKIIKNLVILVIFVSSISCSTKVKTILTKIEKYDGKEVKIKGKVEGPTNILMTKYFFIDDDSGKKIKVVTSNSLPAEGTKTKVKGKVVQRFKVGEFQWVVIKENEKK